MELKTLLSGRSFNLTPAEKRLAQLELLQEMLEVVRATVDLYKKRPTAELEGYVRLFKQNYDDYKKELGV